MIPTEAQEGDTLVAYLRVKSYKFTHIANETGHSIEAKRRAVRVKRQGVSKGFPDYIVLLKNPKIMAHGVIAIELKRVKGSSTSQEQKDWIEALNKSGVPAAICKGADEAIKFIELYDKA